MPKDADWATAHGYIAYLSKMSARESGVAVTIRMDWAKKWHTKITECERHYVGVNKKDVELKIASIYVPPKCSRFYDQDWTEAAMMRWKEVDIAAGDMNFRPQQYEEKIIRGDAQLPMKPDARSHTIGARSNREKTIFDCWPFQLQTCAPKSARAVRRELAGAPRQQTTSTTSGAATSSPTPATRSCRSPSPSRPTTRR